MNFIDPTAFFGSFYNDKLNVINDGVINKWKGEDLYTNLISKFLNKNRCYIDIRNEFNFSLNYFKNYGASATNNTTDIKAKKGSGSSLSTVNYYNNSWPILIIDNTGFSANSSNFQEVTLQLPAGNGDNPAPLIYYGKAYSTDSFPEEYEKQRKFKSLAVNNNYTDEFSFNLPWINANLLSSYVQLKYCKQGSTETLPPAIDTQIRKSGDIDCIFSQKMHFNYETLPLKTKVYSDIIYIDFKETKGYDAVFLSGIAFDLEMVTLFANLQEYNEYSDNEITLPYELSGEFNHLSAEPVFLERFIVKYQERELSKVDDNVILSFKLADWDSIINVTEFNNKYPSFISTGNTRVEFINGESYSVKDIVLKGYKINADVIKIESVYTQININSLIINN